MEDFQTNYACKKHIFRYLRDYFADEWHGCWYYPKIEKWYQK